MSSLHAQLDKLLLHFKQAEFDWQRDEASHNIVDFVEDQIIPLLTSTTVKVEETALQVLGQERIAKQAPLLMFNRDQLQSFSIRLIQNFRDQLSVKEVSIAQLKSEQNEVREAALRRAAEICNQQRQEGIEFSSDDYQNGCTHCEEAILAEIG